jgi:hypothetical protein
VDCLACGEPVLHGRVLSGFSEACYRRWVRRGRPDRAKFISETRAAKTAEREAREAREKRNEGSDA